jgi:hypothetical protein
LQPLDWRHELVLPFICLSIIPLVCILVLLLLLLRFVV